MSVKIDETDAGILKALMEDGRRSLREIARVVQVSTPTVESRLKRLFDMGVIKKISPVLDPDKIEHGIYVLINLRALQRIRTRKEELARQPQSPA